jgi:hypothetical protein
VSPCLGSDGTNLIEEESKPFDIPSIHLCCLPKQLLRGAVRLPRHSIHDQEPERTSSATHSLLPLQPEQSPKSPRRKPISFATMSGRGSTARMHGTAGAGAPGTTKHFATGSNLRPASGTANSSAAGRSPSNGVAARTASAAAAVSHKPTAASAAGSGSLAAKTARMALGGTPANVSRKIKLPSVAMPPGPRLD